MASQWPGEPPPGTGDAPGAAPPGQPLPGQGPPGQPPPGQPLHGKPLRGEPPAQRPPMASDNRFYVVLLSVAAVVVVLGLGGCAVLSAIVNDSVDETSKKLDDSLRKSQNRDSITDEQAKAVEVGADRNDIVRRFGPPAFGPAKEPGLPAGVRDCISWHLRDGRFGSVWEFCFRDAKLISMQSTEEPEPGGRRPPQPRKRTPSQEE